MKLYTKHIVVLLGSLSIQNASACTRGFAMGAGPTEHLIVIFLLLCTEIVFLFKFIQWMIFNNSATQIKKVKRRYVYGILLIISTILLLLSALNYKLLSQISICPPEGRTIIIPN